MADKIEEHPKGVQSVEHLIVDAGAFIRNANIADIGTNIYTIQSVVDEIRDQSTKQRLQVLPYELHFTEPNAESITFATNFAKKTGDYPSLSPTDIRLIAATYQLHCRHVGVDSIRAEPNTVRTVLATSRPPDNPLEIAGFHVPRRAPAKEEVEEGGESDGDSTSSSNDASDVDEDMENEETSDDDDWIGPNNLQSALLRSADGAAIVDDERVTVACLSTDFAIQNVLMHMGVHIISIAGIRIRRLKSYILRCRSCFALLTVTDKKFCPRCGNQSLHRAAVTVNADGTTQVHLSMRKAATTRGLKYSLPAPKGGKHSTDPVLFEDQRVAHNRLARKAQPMRIDPLDASDYVAMDSPFHLNDVTSRSALLGIRNLHKDRASNPNASHRGKKRGGKKR